MILSSKLCKLIIMLSFVLDSEATKVMGSREPRVSESFNKSKSSKLIRVEFKKQSKGTCLLSWAAFPRSVVTISFQFNIGEVKNKKSICRRSHICVSLCVHMWVCEPVCVYTCTHVYECAWLCVWVCGCTHTGQDRGGLWTFDKPQIK